MNIEEIVISIWANDPTCSGFALYPLYADPNDEDDPLDDPYATYIIYSNNRDYTLDGQKDNQVHLQVSCFSTSYISARDLRNATIAAFETSQLTDTSLAVYDSDEQNFYENATKMYHCLADIHFWWNGK